MRRGLLPRGLLRVTAAAGCVAFLCSGTGVAARDNGGIQDFLAQQFGFGAPVQSAPMPAWDDPDDSRPLVVRPRHRRTVSAPRRVDVAKLPAGPVSIYEDRTLRRGDAVMTAQGIRIFRGADSLPYRDTDFVAISDANGLSPTVAKALLAINKLPRS